MNRNIKNRISIATVCNQWEEIAKQYGVSTEMDVYCTSEHMDEEKRDQAKAVADHIQAVVPCGVFHGPFNELFPAAIDPKARKLAMDRMNQAAEICLQRGIKKMVLHSGYMPFVYFVEYHIERSVDFWQEFMADKPEDFCLCIENVLEDEPEILTPIIEKLDDPRVGMCLDVGHAAAMGKKSAEEWVRQTAPYLNHLHIHNNDGSHDYHRPVHEGVIDMESVLDYVIGNCSTNTTITLETIDGISSMLWLKEKGYL